jgi:hypothetical protein
MIGGLVSGYMDEELYENILIASYILDHDNSAVSLIFSGHMYISIH